MCLFRWAKIGVQVDNIDNQICQFNVFNVELYLVFFTPPQFTFDKL